MSRHFARLILVVFAVAAPSITSAQSGQSAISGVVRDSTGAVLPGVTVEASSPALIEKSRSAVTDEAGQYRVVDLRPGTYRVTFTLQGFTTLIRDGIVLESNFVAPVNVDMAVGGVEQAIIVTGESPIVDVQSSQRRDVVNSEMLEALPTGRSFVTMAGTVPAVSTGQFDVGGSTSMWQGGSLTVHGSLNVDSRTLIDGMVADAMFAGGQCACVYDNEAQTQEIAVQVSAGSAENQLSGVLVNRIPRSGGNTLSAELLTNFSNNDLASQNLDDELIARGLPTPAELYKQYDINYTVAGPVIRDRLWFFVSGRNWAYNNYVGGAFNADGTQAVDDNSIKAFPARLTAQITQNNKVTALFTWSEKLRGHANLSATIAPEASLRQSQPAQHIAQAKWTWTPSSHVLLDAGYNQTYNNAKYEYVPEVAVGTCHTAFNMCPPGTGYGSIPHQDLTLGLNTVAAVTGTGVQTGPQRMPTMSHYLQSSLSYVTGSHNMKVGLQQRVGWQQDKRQDINADLTQQYQERRAHAGVDLQHADRQPERSGRRPGPVRAGHMDQRANHDRARAAGRLLQHLGSGTISAGRPLRAGAPVRRDSRHCKLVERVAAAWRFLRPLRHREDRPQRQSRIVRAVAGHWFCRNLQSNGDLDRHADLERSEPRRHRPGERDRAHEQRELRPSTEPESVA